MMGTTENIFPRDSRTSAMLTKLQEQILDSRRLAHRAKYKDVFSKSSCMIYTFRISALASCFALSPASMQSSARRIPQVGTEILVLYVQDVLYTGFVGAKIGHKKITIF